MREMAVWTKMYVSGCILVIWLSLVSCTIHIDDDNLSKSVRKFLNLYDEERNQNERELDWWKSLRDEQDLNPKIRLLAHLVNLLVDSTEISGPIDENTNDNDEEPSVSEGSIFNDESEPTENDLYPLNLIYGKGTLDRSRNEIPLRSADKRNGIWYGKRDSDKNLPSSKRNGLWYGKRNGFWYGKRNGFWYGKRSQDPYLRQADEIV